MIRKVNIVGLEVDMEDKERKKGFITLEMCVEDIDRWKDIWCKRKFIEIDVKLKMR